MINADFLRVFREKLQNVHKAFVTLNLHMLFHKTMSFGKAAELVGVYRCIKQENKEDFRTGLSLLHRLFVFYPQLRAPVDKLVNESVAFLQQQNHKSLRLLIVRNFWKSIEITAWLQLMDIDEEFSTNRSTYRRKYKNDCNSITIRKKKLGVQ